MACEDHPCCCISSVVIIICCLIVIPVTLTSVGVTPRFYIQQVFIPALNNSDSFNSTNLNTSIFIDFRFKRVLAFVPIRYQDVNITLYYIPNKTSSVGFGVIPPFGQGMKKTVHRKAAVEAPGLPWEDALQKVSGGSPVTLAVEMATKYSLKRHRRHYGCIYTKPKAAVVAAEVQLDGSGHKVSKNPTRLQ